jgi:hypothetical protein
MSALRIWIVLLALLSGGFAHASYSSFDNTPRASDEVLDRMRGGFVVSWNGLEFLMPFTIDGIERLTQINGQTYINGELITAALNPRALTPFQQAQPISVNVQVPSPVADSGMQENVNAPSADPAAQITSAADTTAQTGASGSPPAETALAAAESPPASAPATQVSTNGSLIVIQNGVANAVVLPPNVSLDSLATFIQNSVNNQVILNITTLNLTIEAQMLAMQARLSAIHNQSLNGLR